MRGSQGLAAGDRVTLTLIGTDAVHGFIDFEHSARVEPRKVERRLRKQEQALTLRTRIGESFDAVVTGVNEKATYVRVDDPQADGRLVRGNRGLSPGERVRVTLLDADPERGWIDFARAD
jgi:exoribonuclease R